MNYNDANPFDQWAAELAESLPPMTDAEIATAARAFMHIDEREDQKNGGAPCKGPRIKAAATASSVSVRGAAHEHQGGM